MTRTTTESTHIAERLERLQNRPTKYELVATDETGTRYLVGYTQISKNGILAMIRKNGEAWTARLKKDDMITFAKRGQSATMGRFAIAFSGRTQRDAICNGELPWFADAILPIK